MKKLFLFSFFLILYSALFGQSPIERGSFTINGSISYSSQSFDDVTDNQTIFNFNPQIGYFFVNNIYTAASITYRNISSGNVSNYIYGIGPTVRYYFDSGKIKPFLVVGFNYLLQTNSTNDDEIKSTEIRLTGGMNYFISNNFALEASLNYSFIEYKMPSGYFRSNSPKSKLFQLAIGVN